jgi:glycosyltransferase involved in cell wall biosynthesis
MVAMSKILIALVAQIKKRDRFTAVLDGYEHDGYTVHLIDSEELSSFELDTLDSAVGYLQYHYGEFESISLLCNSKSHLFAWYHMQHSAIKDYILYVEDAIEEDHFIGKDKDKIVALNDFSNFQITGIEPIRILFEDWDQILSLIANYTLYINPYENEKVTSSLYPVLPTGWDDVLESKLFQDVVRYLNAKNGLSAGIVVSILIPFVVHTTKSSEIVYDLLCNTIEEYSKLDATDKNNAIVYFDKLIPLFTPQCQICVMSLLYELTHEKKYILGMFEEKMIRHFNSSEKASIFWTVKHMNFVGKVEFNLEEVIAFRRFYQSCVDEIAQQVRLPKAKPAHLRNKDRIVMITSQFLGIGHAPTRNVIDYSRNLKKMGKEVFIINSADLLMQNSLPFLNPTIGSFMDIYNPTEVLEFEDERYRFYQSKNSMPNLQDIQRIIELVEEFNPEFIIAISDGVLTADVCSYFTTVVTIPCGAVVPMSTGTCWAIPRMTLPSDKEIFQAFNVPKERVFPIHYTFMKKEKETQLSRKDLHLPEDEFILCVVGNRLDVEVTTEFIERLKQILYEVPEAYILFIGGYSSYDKIMEQHSLLKERSSCTGHRSDIQSIYTLCNAYLNPPRQGGATSGAEAMLEGLPVITEPRGDVYYQLWLEQSFTTTEDIILFIKRCIKEPEYYLEQRKQTKIFGEKLFDTASMMKELVSYTENYISNH